jgi:hypothetical protein
VSASRWKRHERETARALGTTRLPNSGAGQPDCRPPGWAVQVKTRATVPDWLFVALDQATRDAGPGERAAVVLVNVSQGVKARRLVLLPWADFVALVTDERGADEAERGADEGARGDAEAAE